MENKQIDQLIIVQNSNSTRAGTIDEKVFSPLKAHGISYDVYHTEWTDTEGNIAAMQLDIPAGATIISAAGDGTAMQLANASIRGNKAWTLGFMPLGNFNDHARSRAGRDDTVLDILAAPKIDTIPLTIEVNGEYWRHASAYMTMGWTALAASQFGNAESRQSMKDAPSWQKLARSLGQLAGNYYKNRHTLLPALEANGLYQDAATDIIAANSPRIGSIVRSKDTYYDKSYFGTRTDINVSHIAPNIPFGVQAISGYAPFERADEMRIVFERTSTVPVQTEGEFQWVEASEIFVYKNLNEAISVLHPKQLPRR
jgi:diacylglycerol kinase family enzyme